MTNALHGVKRKVLIVEDNELNREILETILEDTYDVLAASNGEEGIEVLSKHYRELSLIILDVYMPVCDGFEFLERTQSDSMLGSVPVLVATGSNKPADEIRCLELGASDFVTKPYNPEVVIARAGSIIKLRESVATLSMIEYDKPTGLYTLQAFVHHVKSVLNSDPVGKYAISVAEISNLKLINDVYGERAGEDAIAYIAKFLQKGLPDALLAHFDNKFYCCYAKANVSEPYDFDQAIKEVVANAPVPQLVVKLGLYLDVDRDVPVSVLCDRAATAAASIKDDFAKRVALYDDAIQSRIIEEQNMEAAFDSALANKEFKVYYQPKVDVQTEKIVAAEALVRWIPGDGRFISPGAFIPLFERDGLISRLDEYVFRKVCEFQRDRVQAKKDVVPISINLSRNSIYNVGTVENYGAIINECGLSHDLVPIELTESSAIDGAEVLALMNKFSDAGFYLHMDDFGSGFSSLSSLASMPFSVVKLDKSIIDGIGDPKSNILIRNLVNMGQEMGMKIVAEGAETEDQVAFLREVGCDMIQGYFYAPPLKQADFEAKLES